MGPPRFPGSPSCAFAPVRDPGRTDGPSPMTVPPVLPLLHRKQRLRRDVYIEATAGLKHLLSTLQERRCHRHMQDSLPVGWLAFTGRELNPLDRDERFPSTTSLPPFLDLSWRYCAKTPERLQRVERPPANCEWHSPDLRQKPQVEGSRRIGFPSVNALLGFSHNQGQSRRPPTARDTSSPKADGWPCTSW